MLRRLIFLLLCASLTGFAQTQRPFTFEDMMQLKRVGDPIVSPDSKWVGFTAVDVNLDENTRKPDLWIVPVAGGEARRLTPSTGPGADRIRFAPDTGSILFAADKDGSSQVWVQSFDSTRGALTG
jgi:Tol biopolymer transport system component